METQTIEKGFERVWQMFQETDLKFKETDLKFKETDRKFQKTEKEIDRVSRNVDALTGKWGRFVEGLIAPGIIAMFQRRGIEIDRIFQRVRARKDGNTMEIDILGVNTEYAVIVEAKSTLSVDDVKEHIETLKIFKHFFPEYADRKLVGAVAGIVIDGDADKFAYRQGLFVIGQTGESANILNNDKFIPKLW